MKNLLTLLAVLFMSIASFAQVQTIPNFSFENWSENGGYLYPDHWIIETTNAIQSGAIAGNNDGTDGNYSIYFGSFNNNGTLTGSGCRIEDTLISNVGGVSFDYLVQNNTSSMWNSLSLSIHFYGSNGDYLDDFSWFSEPATNYSNFTQGVFNFTPPANSYTYHLSIGYTNVGGNTNEFAIVDNVRFIQGTNDIVDATSDEFLIYPNPTSSSINFNIPQTNGTISITDITGAIIYSSAIAQEMNNISLSSFSVGTYFLNIETESGIIREKILKI